LPDQALLKAADVVVFQRLVDRDGQVSELLADTDQGGSQRLRLWCDLGHQIKTKLVGESSKRAHITGVQQNPEQVLNSQPVGIVVRVGALEQAHVRNAHLCRQGLGFVVQNRRLAGPQEIFHP